MHHPDRQYGHRDWVVGQGKLVPVAKTGLRLDLFTACFLAALVLAIALIWVYV